jgi:uncharacterized membrane protein
MITHLAAVHLTYMGPAQRNIAAIVRLEQEYLQKRGVTARLVDLIVDSVGTMPSFLFHMALFACWILINNGVISDIRPWDPFPFILLTMLVSMEGVVLALFVLMKQNRMSRRADEREHLHLQVNLLAEKEITRILQLQQSLADHLGVREISDNPEIRELAEETVIEKLANEVKRNLPDT